MDTAGFGAADLEDSDTFHDIMGCLTVMGPLTTIAGALYVYGDPAHRYLKDDMRTVRWLECFCGPKFFSNITLVTTHWDVYFKQRLFKKSWTAMKDLQQAEDLKRILHPPGRYHGGSLYFHGIPGGCVPDEEFNTDRLLDIDDDQEKRGEEARSFIRRKYGGGNTVNVAQLQILSEIEKGVAAVETQAYKVLTSDLARTKICISEGFALVSSEMSGTAALAIPDKQPLELAAGSQKSEPRQSPQEGAPPEPKKAQPNRRTAPSPSIWNTIATWIGIAYRASSYFEEARKTKYESKNSARGNSGPLWTLWGVVSSWLPGSGGR